MGGTKEQSSYCEAIGRSLDLALLSVQGNLLMENYIQEYCKARGIAFGQAGLTDELITLVPKRVALETDIMPVIEVVISEEDISKILISIGLNICVWRKG